MNTLTDVDVAWLAGIYEGEGTCAIRGSSIRVEIVMTDEDILTRVHDLTGIGSLRPINSRNPDYKQAFRWSVGSYGAVDFLTLVLPWLGQRRTSRAEEALDAWVTQRKQRRSNDTHCVRGHELIGDNLFVNGKSRSCRTCRRAAQARFRKKQREAKLLLDD